MLAVDLHRLEQLGQTGRGHDGVRRHLLALEDLAAPRAHIGGADKQLGHDLGVRGLDQRIEIHHPGQQLTQRVDIERIGLIGRKKLVEHAHDLRTRQRHAPEHIAHAAHGTHAFPQLGQGFAGQTPPQLSGVFRLALLHCRLGKTVGQHHGIHGTSAGAADAFKHQTIMFQQRIQHAPGQRAMRAAALQGQIDGVGCC